MRNERGGGGGSGPKVTVLLVLHAADGVGVYWALKASRGIPSQFKCHMFSGSI